MEASSHIPGKHANGYNMDRSGRLYDLTEINQSWANAAGDMVSTVEDLTTFFSALLGGKLLNQELMNQMLTTVDSPIGKVDWEFMKRKHQTGNRIGDMLVGLLI